MMRTAMDYSDYQHLLFDRKENGVLLVTLNRPDVYNATDARLHWELTQIWRTVDADPKTKVVLVTGAGKAFSAGGDISMLDQIAGKPEGVLRAMREAADIVYEMTNLDKPIITAINGVAVGAGLAVALCADISIMSETAKITDGHVKLGVGAGDHAAILWPILCGMAKAKYYLLTADFIDGKEAERIGLVSLCTPPDQLMDKAWEVANKLAAGSQLAIRVTKRSLNNWLRMAGPIFDNSLALEMLCFLGPDATEGVAALKERRPPRFPSAE
jgi:enoyl-CoA hydratase